MMFDRPSRASPFLDFVRREFARRGTALRRELSTKARAREIVAAEGLRTPRTIRRLEDLSRLSPAMLPDRCVLKPERGWSAKGVMLLERTAPERWIDHLSLRVMTVSRIAALQARAAETIPGGPRGWVVEERVDSPIPGKPIPFDYKFYCFRDRIGLIVQIDRNANPAKIALFDGGFTPLVPGRDYVLRGRGAQPGVPVLPRSADAMAEWARRLSLMTDSPFVSIDLYDSPEGPVFGEFTFSPGGAHKRMWLFSHAMLDRLDALLEAAGERPEPAPRAALAALGGRTLPVPALAEYGAFAGWVSNGGSRGARRLAAWHARATRKAEARGDAAEAEALAALERAWTAVAEGIGAGQARDLAARRAEAGEEPGEDEAD